MIIRRERPSDHAAVHAVHEAAFAVDPRTGAPRAPDDVREARLVDRLREDAGFLPHLSLVAVDDGVVVGHVIATRGWLEPYGTAVLGLGPLGIVPAPQRRGTGTALVHAVLAVAEAAGERLVALLGAPGYYGRLGFVPALALGVTSPDPAWGSYFQARLLQGDPVGGAFRYAEPFSHL
ncbi:GNAT family N-acetyltransferase [Blastococcus sp. TBT05-19]|uniref:GNAT family N-acetyltransferase n=1 Tax=Blastococcus sp. TBT05-19 TaxID=2250581 RepID=UPI000DEAA088|nr:N-acetyltransferase [Blastococcus sp. TBT05-19]RBY95079.1 GNAT family N-acetyltransferase [Blastococcus sp. TBT05-19]